MKPLAIGIILASGICATTSAAPLTCTITELPLPWGDTFAQPVELAGFTKHGGIAGKMIGAEWIVFFLDGDDAQVLATVSDVAGYFNVYDVNRKGDVVGSFNTGLPIRALLWSEGTTRELGTLGGGLAAPYGINDHGDIVGASTVAGEGRWHPFLYQKGNMVDLGVFGGTDAFALAINNKRQVALDLQDESGHRLAIYDHGQLKIVGTLGNWTPKLAINEAGHVVGETEGHAFYYDGHSMINLTGELFSTSKSINNRDELVGTWSNPWPSGGFLYRAGQRIDLSELLPPGSGWTILTAEHINDSGQIVGLGMFGGVSKFYVMTPAALSP